MIRLLSETSLFYLTRHASVILTVCLPRKDVFANERPLLEENSGAQWLEAAT